MRDQIVSVIIVESCEGGNKTNLFQKDGLLYETGIPGFKRGIGTLHDLEKDPDLQKVLRTIIEKPVTISVVITEENVDWVLCSPDIQLERSLDRCAISEESDILLTKRFVSRVCTFIFNYLSELQ